MRRYIQTAFLIVFLVLLFTPAVWLTVPRHVIIGIDPLIAAGVTVASRTWIWLLLPGFIVLVSGLFVGRWFCGNVCPMGTTIDILGGMSRFLRNIWPKAEYPPFRSCRKIKYLLLAGLMAASAFGISLVHWFAPMPYVTRLYGTLVHAAAINAGEFGMESIRDILAKIDWYVFENTFIDPRHYAGLWFVAVFFGFLLLSEYFVPRFWCRYVCPAGAAIGLVSFLPLFRRRVEKCVKCGRCRQACPAGAVGNQGMATEYGECLSCGACKRVCPVKAIRFNPSVPVARWEQEGCQPSGVSGCVLPKRRQFLAAFALGAAAAAVELSGVGRVGNSKGSGMMAAPGFLRPPGAIPEPDFLTRCVRCGLCIRQCPENALQPAGIGDGLTVFATPVLLPRSGFCLSSCKACGDVCPTGALRALPLTEKQWAKIGTAAVKKNVCQVWADGIYCGSCQYACPYGAITLVDIPGSLGHAPVVDASRCFGCGACEKICPMESPAIVVLRKGAVRLKDGSYVESGKYGGLDLEIRTTRNAQ